jgi:acetyltransferase-like isoleucine patch superfamily enzyme
MTPDRKLPWDWYDGTVPLNASLDETAYLESAHSFRLYRSLLDRGVQIGKASSVYQGTMFDVGVSGSVHIGNFSLVNGAWFISDCSIEVGDYTLISWNVVLMDSYRASVDPEVRRQDLIKLPDRIPRSPSFSDDARRVVIGSNVWIGFEVCILPGVQIGDGSIVGARSVVMADVPPYSIAAGNPARVIRRLERPNA